MGNRVPRSMNTWVAESGSWKTLGSTMKNQKFITPLAYMLAGAMAFQLGVNLSGSEDPAVVSSLSDAAKSCAVSAQRAAESAKSCAVAAQRAAESAKSCAIAAQRAAESASHLEAAMSSWVSVSSTFNRSSSPSSESSALAPSTSSLKLATTGARSSASAPSAATNSSASAPSTS